MPVTRRKRRPRVRQHRLRRSSRKQRGGDGPQPPTFHILIASGGRPTLKNLLESIKNELTDRDAVTIVFDGSDKKSKAGWSDDWIKGFKAPVAVLEEKENMGHWGHPVRTAYQGKLKPQTTFIMHADDDDEYLPGFAHGLRETCTDPSKLHIGRMMVKSTPKTILPTQFQEVKYGDIGTPCGIIPWAEAARAEWPKENGGDFKYYEKLASTLGKDRVSFIPNIFYLIGK